MTRTAGLVLTMCLLVEAIPQWALGYSSVSQGRTESALNASSEGALRARVSKWWTARQERDHQTMYELYDPVYRKRVSFSAFLRESAVRTRYDILSHAITKITPEADARVRVKIKYAARFPQIAEGLHEVDIEEIYVEVDGYWFKVYEPPRLPILSEPKPRLRGICAVFLKAFCKQQRLLSQSVIIC